MSRGASPSSVADLIEAYPDGCKVADNAGNLPLHAAVLAGASLPIVTQLLDIYPAATKTSNHFYKAPLMIATEMGVSEVLLKAILEAEHKANSIFGAVEKGLAALQKAKGKGGLFAPLASLWGR